MNRKFFLVMLTIGMYTTFRVCGQTPVTVAESTVKIGPFGEEVFYYGFAAGDKLVFNFEEANKKELKEFEIMEMPATSRYMEYKTKKIENKILDIVNTGIYKFRFTNSNVFPKVCKFSIQRIPASAATQNFNTTVYTHMVDDTVYTDEQENYIDRTDTVLQNFQDRSIKVQTAASTSGNKAVMNFILPENTIAWGYYIYINDAGKKIYEDAMKKVSEGPTPPKFQNYGPLAAHIYGTESYLKKLAANKPINYWIVEGDNADLFMKGDQFKYMRKGTAENDYARMDNRKGTLYFCFSNGLATEPVTVTVKITSLHINEVPKVRMVKRVISIKPKSEMYLKN
ncbi:MAG TPA: hypothetical protein VG676_08095 [Chitinophagaceae bacterium]|jgi:hypothetical protein|nr:hypothetical protein [Chitinophagaceae bacterium]